MALFFPWPMPSTSKAAARWNKLPDPDHDRAKALFPPLPDDQLIRFRAESTVHLSREDENPRPPHEGETVRLSHSSDADL
jgi:hypothetical protein